MDRDDNVEDLERKTRSVFDAHHREQADSAVYDRLTTLVSAEYFQLEPGRFQGKAVLDAGCGTNANASRAFLRLGAAHVHSVDLGDSWMPVAAEKLAEFGGRSSLGSENVLQLEIPDDTYDFVHCAGVLHHTADPRQGHRELARVTKPGGYTFITVMAQGNGLLYQIINMLRDKYNAEPEFRKTIDNLSAGGIQDGLDWLLAVKGQHEPGPKGEADALSGLFDADLVLTIKDRLQAPTYWDFDFSESQLRAWYEELGYGDVRRLTRYTYGMDNLRKYLAPMYLHYDNPMARFWFGDGYVQLMGRKP